VTKFHDTGRKGSPRTRGESGALPLIRRNSTVIGHNALSPGHQPTTNSFDKIHVTH